MKKFTLLFLTVILALTMFSLPAAAGTYGDLTYSISGGEVAITDCNTGASGAMNIPTA